jgi:ribosomal protein L12E/L44/L45/RPP1/RPP2
MNTINVNQYAEKYKALITKLLVETCYLSCIIIFRNTCSHYFPLRYRKMVLTDLTTLSDAQKQELVASLSAIVVGSAADDVTADAISAVAEASGNSIDASYAALFSSVVAMAGGLDKFCAAPGSGGGGGGAAASGGEAAAAEEEEPEEEEEAGMEDAIDMFGGDEGGDY